MKCCILIENFTAKCFTNTATEIIIYPIFTLNYLMIYLYTIFYFLILYTNHQNFPGLHGDEAYFGIVAKKILNQPFYSVPVNGMNNFTSGFHSKLVSWLFLITKDPISVLRLPSITLNTLMFFLILKNFKKNIHLSSLIFFLTSFCFFTKKSVLK